MPAPGTKQGSHTDLSAAIKKQVSIPVATVGRITDAWVADEIIANELADACYIGRANLCEPEFANKVYEGREIEVRPCIGCGRCLNGIMFGKRISCTINPSFELENEDTLTEAEVKKNVLVIGGGPAGMEAAFIAKKRGHNVVLCEAEEELGGALRVACVPIAKQELTKVVQFLAHRIKAAGVDVRLNTPVTKEMLEGEFAGYEVVAAAGAKPNVIDAFTCFKQAVTADDILAGKAYINQLLHPLSYFREYLKSGYYPFATNGNFEVRMQNIVIQTIETDIATYANLKTTTARKLRKMLTVVASLAPFKPNADTLATTLSVSRNNISDYLILLEQTQMIGQLRDDTQGIRGLGKVEKVYLDNPNLMYVLNGGNIDTGNLRETFFYNQMRVNHDVTSSRIADFAINEYTFEVGGRNKSQKQLGNTTHGFVVKDDIEFAQGNIIPLWAFGLNY